MADRPERPEGPQRPKPVPPIVPPVRPVVPPVKPPVMAPLARPVVPPTLPPTVPPTLPPTLPPVLAPVAPPVLAPVVQPIAPSGPPPRPPTLAPVAPPAPPPTMKPVAAPPTLKPVAPPAAAPAPAKSAGTASKAGGGSKAGGRAARDEGRAERSPREARGAAAPASGGPGVGAKVALLCGLVTALCLAIAVLPTLKDTDDPTAPFHDTGLAAAQGVATGLGGASLPPPPAAAASAKSPLQQAIEMLATGIEGSVKDAGLGGEYRGPILAGLGLIRDAAAGKSIQKTIDDMLAQVSRQLQTEKDADKQKTLRDERERLIRIASLFDGPAPAPTAPAGTTAAIGLPATSTRYTPLAVWWMDPAGKLAAQSAKDLALPPSSTVTQVGAGGWYGANVAGVAATVFYADAGNASRRLGRVFVAFQDPPVGGGGGNKLGLLMLILAPLLVGGIGYAIANGFGKPLKDLARELDRLGSSGDPARRIGAHGPEANAIARSVERMVANLKFRDQHEMADLQEVAAKEQGVAAEIHHGLMPKDPPRIAGWEVETLFKPGFEIGGDHFDYFRIDDTHLGVILMDTSVRGIPAAIVMSMARAYVRAQAPGVLSPAELLMKVNRILASDLSQGQYVTALYVVIDTGNGTAKVASAGHLPLVVYRHGIGKTAIVNPEGIALGLDIGPVFDRSVTEVEIDIGVGDRIVLHTDGALKVQNETGDEYGEARLYDAIKQKAPMNSQAFVNFVGSGIDVFHATTPQNDDITISTVKRLK